MKTIVVTTIEDGVVLSVRKVEMGATPTYGAIEPTDEDKRSIARIAGTKFKEPPVAVEPIPEPEPKTGFLDSVKSAVSNLFGNG